ncbi:MAG: translation initiation factor [Muribaculaceae bacterium]|nr:translation initiation factor [Muribaculaceae bacterium]
MNDWMNTLGALRSSLPGSEIPPEESIETADAPDKQAAASVTLHVQRSTKGRAGKVATIVYGFNDDTEANRELIAQTAANLRRFLGTGGSHRGTEILIQGDRCDDVASRLRQLGFKVKIG